MSKKHFYSVLFFLFTIGILNAQKAENNPFYTGVVTTVEHVTSIASKSELIPSKTKPEQMMDGRSSGNVIVPFKDNQTEDDYFTINQHPLTQKVQGKAPDLVFNAYSSNSEPTDPDLAVGPNHVFVVLNTGFIIYNKDGDALTDEIYPYPAIFPANGCCDLTVSHDSAADRWIVSFLSTTSGAQIAVSDGPDPVNDGWYVYTISAITDYQKLSIWSDGYYLTDNTSSTNKIWAMERSEMLAGNPAAKVVGFNLPGIVTSGFFSPQAFNISSGNMPVAGNAPIVYLQDDAWSGVSTDHVKLWLVNVDWQTTSNSTISNPTQITTTPFISVFDNGSFSNLTQPGGGVAIDALQATIMNQAQFRKFPTHNSAVFNFVVDTDASSGELAGIRWFELRQTGDNQPWTLYQEGTYTAPDSRHAWHGSMIMDVQGNIGMGYTSMSSASSSNTNVRVSSYYTGRYANDPLGTMTIAEELVANGNANIPSYRYGDYNKIDVDPFDDKTFWFINEYMNGGRKGVVGRFKIAPNFNDDLGVVSIDTPNTGNLTANESVSITIFNYGQNVAANFPVSYQINGGTVITETFTGSIASADYGTFTFSTTGDFSAEGQEFVITAYTDLSGDEDASNDAITKTVTHLFSNDLGVTSVIAPISGNNLALETVTVEISNFGGLAQSNFDVSYILDFGNQVVEQVPGPLNPGTTMQFSFATLGDFSSYTTHELVVSTQLSGDAVVSNDAQTVQISNSSCIDAFNETDYPIGPDANTVTNSIVNVTEDKTITKVTALVNLTHTWDADIDMFLIGPDNTSVELSTDNGSSGDNFTNTVFDDVASVSIVDGTAPFTGVFKPEGILSSFLGKSSFGNWNLQITDDANVDGGTLTDWTLTFCFSESAGIFDDALNASDIILAEVEKDVFDVIWETDAIKEQLVFTVYNIMGQEIVYYKLINTDGKYFYHLDMSYATPGVYLLRLGNADFAKVKRFIVK